jgi:hypothetical protein
MFQVHDCHSCNMTGVLHLCVVHGFVLTGFSAVTHECRVALHTALEAHPRLSGLMASTMGDEHTPFEHDDSVVVGLKSTHLQRDPDDGSDLFYRVQAPVDSVSVAMARDAALEILERLCPESTRLCLNLAPRLSTSCHAWLV